MLNWRLFGRITVWLKKHSGAAAPLQGPLVGVVRGFKRLGGDDEVPSG